MGWWDLMLIPCLLLITIELIYDAHEELCKNVKQIVILTRTVVLWCFFMNEMSEKIH